MVFCRQPSQIVSEYSECYGQVGEPLCTATTEQDVAGADGNGGQIGPRVAVE